MQGLRRQITKGRADKDTDDELIADILKSNIYGVDINSASVEISRLALWLHTARGDKPLSSLNENIREGNSLIGSDFFKGQIDLAFYDATQKERVNAFDWEKAFPVVFERGGFDAVVGSPPYVKLQNFRTVHADMATYLREGRLGVRPYMSTQTGNFDLYLPFIEKGISLLNDEGCLGYIAPSLWIANEYGEGLRNLIASGCNLDRWVDFKSYQVFEEATTYTALQFFTKSRNPVIRVADARTGSIPDSPWADASAALRYGHQNFGDRWLLLTGSERALIDRLYESCTRLDDAANTKQIFQGLITSADAIYHLTRKGPGRYLCSPKGDDAPPPYEVILEDDLMKPLVSGVEAKRYVEPVTQTYLLFPYQIADDKVKLIDSATIQAKFPKAWAYLSSYREELRLRESKRNRDGEITEAPFDDDQWYRFGRHQNLDKQEIAKLIVAQTVPEMRVCFDNSANMYLNNVRVNGIILAEKQNPWFLLGILNSGVVDFVFRRIAKVKAGGFFEANKQFIAPLPIPPANAEDRGLVATRAKALQSATSERRDILFEIERRLSSVRTRSRPETWIFPNLRTKRNLMADAPNRLSEDKRHEWANKRYELDLASCYASITARLTLGASLSASFIDGELSFAIDGVPVIDRLFVGAPEGEFVVAQWKVTAATFSITEKTDGKKLANALRKLALPDNPALVTQIIEREKALSLLEADIARQESEMEMLVHRLYGLTETEARLVARG